MKNWGKFLDGLQEKSFSNLGKAAATGFGAGIMKAWGSARNLEEGTDLELGSPNYLLAQSITTPEKYKQLKSTLMSGAISLLDNTEVLNQIYDDALNNRLRYVDTEEGLKKNQENRGITSDNNHDNEQTKYDNNNIKAGDGKLGRFNLALYNALSRADEQDTWFKTEHDDNGFNNTPATTVHINIPVWGYDSLINERNMWVKSISSPYGEPGFFYFKIFFDFNTLDGLLGGILNVANTGMGRNSAAKYFDYCIESGRYGNDLINSRRDALIKFVKTLSYININAPWFFQTISGLGEANTLSFNEINKQRKIEIGCLADAIDMRLSTLLDLYKYAAFDDIKNREILPENLRKFDINVLVFNVPIKRLHTPFKGKKSKYNYKSTSYISTNFKKSNDINDNANYNDMSDFVMSFKLFSFQNCEIDLSSLSSPYSKEFSTKDPIQMDSVKLSINYDKCLTYTSNEFNQILFGSSGFLYNAYATSDGSTREVSLSNSDDGQNGGLQLSQRLQELRDIPLNLNKVFSLDPTKEKNSYIEAGELIAHNNLFKLSGLGFGNIYGEHTKVGSEYYSTKLQYLGIYSLYTNVFRENNETALEKIFKGLNMTELMSDYARVTPKTGLRLKKYISGAYGKAPGDPSNEDYAYWTQKRDKIFNGSPEAKGKYLNGYKDKSVSGGMALEISPYYKNKLYKIAGQRLDNPYLSGTEGTQISTPDKTEEWVVGPNGYKRVDTDTYTYNKYYLSKRDNLFNGDPDIKGAMLSGANGKQISYYRNTNVNSLSNYNDNYINTNYYTDKRDKLFNGSDELKNKSLTGWKNKNVGSDYWANKFEERLYSYLHSGKLNYLNGYKDKQVSREVRTGSGTKSMITTYFKRKRNKLFNGVKLSHKYLSGSEGKQVGDGLLSEYETYYKSKTNDLLNGVTIEKNPFLTGASGKQVSYPYENTYKNTDYFTSKLTKIIKGTLPDDTTMTGYKFTRVSVDDPQSQDPRNRITTYYWKSKLSNIFNGKIKPGTTMTGYKNMQISTGTPGHYHMTDYWTEKYNNFVNGDVTREYMTGTENKQISDKNAQTYTVTDYWNKKYDDFIHGRITHKFMTGSENKQISIGTTENHHMSNYWKDKYDNFIHATLDKKTMTGYENKQISISNGGNDYTMTEYWDKKYKEFMHGKIRHRYMTGTENKQISKQYGNGDSIKYSLTSHWRKKLKAFTHAKIEHAYMTGTENARISTGTAKNYNVTDYWRNKLSYKLKLCYLTGYKYKRVSTGENDSYSITSYWRKKLRDKFPVRGTLY